MKHNTLVSKQEFATQHVYLYFMSKHKELENSVCADQALNGDVGKLLTKIYFPLLVKDSEIFFISSLNYDSNYYIYHCRVFCLSI